MVNMGNIESKKETLEVSPPPIKTVSKDSSVTVGKTNTMIQEIGKENIRLSNPTTSEPKSIVSHHCEFESELKSYVEGKKLKKMTSFLLQNSGSSTTINLQDYRLGTSSNPVALVKQDQWIPMQLIESELDGQISPRDIISELEKVPKQFKREEVLNNLRVLLDRKNDEGEVKRLISIIQNLTKENETFIDEETLKKFEGVEFKDLTRNFAPFIKLGDVSENPTLSKAVKEAIKKDAALPVHQRMITTIDATVIKGGQENIREILATQKAHLEGYDDVLHVKESVKIDEFTLQWGSTELVHPIKSDFLVTYIHISAQDWDAWGQARKAYDLELFQKGGVSAETTHKREEAWQKISDYQVDPLSVCKLAFYETKINANDFHTEQFMIGPDPHHPGRTVIVSVDEGRWGPPGIAYAYGTSAATTFKNSLITHPDCLKPVPEEFKEFLKHRLGEIDQTAKKMEEMGLVLPQEEFKRMEEAYTDVTDTLTALGREKIKDAEIPALAQKYAIAFDTNTTISELKNKITDHLRAKKGELKEKAFAKQSEQSLINEVTREKKMIEYILNTSSSTMYGAFEAGYPELATFMRVLRRMEPDPGKSIAYTPLFGTLAPRNLSILIQTAKKQKSASDEEIAQMEKDLAKLKSDHLVSNSAIALTSNAI
jgi:hypothetical protein